jgi:hypothetical protein
LNLLRERFPGFLAKKPASAEDPVRVSLYYEHFVTLRKFRAEPTRLSAEQDRETARIIHHVAKRYPVSEKTILVGFLNGALAYNVSSREAHIFLFRSKGRNFFIGTLYKLLFILTSFFMAERHKLMIHGAGLRIHARGNLFVGVSGAGKSTVAGYVPAEDVLSDDATVIEKKGGGFRMHASPFSQINMFEKKSGNYHRKKADIARIVFLKKAKRLSLKPRNSQTALAELLLHHIHCFELMDAELKKEVFHACCDLCDVIPSFDLYFQKNDGFLSLL